LGGSSADQTAPGRTTPPWEILEGIRRQGAPPPGRLARVLGPALGPWTPAVPSSKPRQSAWAPSQQTQFYERLTGLSGKRWSCSAVSNWFLNLTWGGALRAFLFGWDEAISPVLSRRRARPTVDQALRRASASPAAFGGGSGPGAGGVTPEAALPPSWTKKRATQPSPGTPQVPEPARCGDVIDACLRRRRGGGRWPFHAPTSMEEGGPALRTRSSSWTAGGASAPDAQRFKDLTLKKKKSKTPSRRAVDREIPPPAPAPPPH